MLFINFYFLPVTCYLRFCLNGCTVDHKSLSNKMLLEHTLGRPYKTLMSGFFESCTCECRNVVNCLVLVELGEKGDVDKIFLGIPEVIWLTEYQTCTITKTCYELRAASPFQVASKHASER